MHDNFPLFRSHIDLAHAFWEKIVTPGDCVIDATAGNGYDSLFLAKRILRSDQGSLYCLDIQEKALEKTKLLLSKELSEDEMKKVHFFAGSHASFPPLESQSIKLIVYNLGYLPGGNKSITTQVESTLLSVKNALPLIQKGGLISITCYPGHQEGEKEEEALNDYLSALDRDWNVTSIKWIQHKQAPSLFLLQHKL